MNEILDSELPKENGANEVTPVEETSFLDAQPEEPTEELLSENEQLTKDEIIQKLNGFLADENLPARAIVESLKHAFFKIVAAENEKAKAEFVENGNNTQDFAENTSAEEEEFKTLYNKIKEKRAQAFVKEEALKEENLKRKLNIIESIRVLVEEASGEEFSKQYNEFKSGTKSSWFRKPNSMSCGNRTRYIPKNSMTLSVSTMNYATTTSAKT